MIRNYLRKNREQFYACSTNGMRDVLVQVGNKQGTDGKISMSISEAEEFMDLLAEAIDFARREKVNAEVVNMEDFKLAVGA